MADKPTPRVARIVAGGKALAGERWQSALSRATGVSQSYLAMITTGERPITDEVERKVASGLLKEADRLRKTADKLDDIAGKILHSLEG
jgi:transcriptional regulator with XRE-family HTH domain